MRDIQVFLGFANSRIAAPLTSMLKTLNTESAEPRKGVVRVGGGGKNRAEPVGKDESDGSNDGGHVAGGGHSGDFDMTFQVIRWHPRHCSPTRTINFDCATINNRYLLP